MKTGIRGADLDVILTEKETIGDYRDIFDPSPYRAIRALRRLLHTAAEAAGYRACGRVKAELLRLDKGCMVRFTSAPRFFIAAFRRAEDMEAALRTLFSMGEGELLCRISRRGGIYTAATEEPGRRAEMIIKEYARVSVKTTAPCGIARTVGQWVERFGI